MRRQIVLSLIAGALLLAGCAKNSPGTSDHGGSPARRIGTSGPVPATPAGGADGYGAHAEREAVESRSYEDAEEYADAPRGLGTAYGEHRHSRVRETAFRRQSPSAPDVVLSMRYDDSHGVSHRAHHGQGSARVGSGGLAVSIMDASGRPLGAFQGSGGETWVSGSAGQRYMIGVENETDWRYEAVVSVDGLDVVDGNPASFHHRGYIVEPFTSAVIEGWRTSSSSVAAFRFSELEDSYAGRKGKGRDIGVIGAAFFSEADRGYDDHDYDYDYRPRRDRRHREHRELRRRDTADPFPG